MAIYAWIAFQYGTLHLAISICIAPFLLLRTPYSTERGLRWGAIGLNWVFMLPVSPNSRTDLKDIINGVWVPIGMFLCVLLVRVAATTATLFTHPIASLRAIPANWLSGIACVDMAQLPAALPGLRSAIQTGRVDREFNWLSPADFFSEIFDGIKSESVSESESDPLGCLWLLILFPLYAVLMLVPAIMYRWSLKGISIIYAPLAWVVNSTFGPEFSDRLRDLKGLALYWLVRLWSGILLLALSVRHLLDGVAPDWPLMWAGRPAAPILDAVLTPHAWPLWQTAWAINAALAWCLYFFADWALARMERGRPLNERKLDTWLRVLGLLRGALSLYIIAMGGFGAWRLATL